ncbi:hypothetical protein MTO96_037550 [Rhipicephalus appendiculatus]
MEREAEVKTSPKFPNDPKTPDTVGQKAALNRSTTHAAKGAKKHASKSGSSRIAKDANKEEQTFKGADHKRKSLAARRRGTSKNLGAAANDRGGRATGSTMTAKHKMVPATEPATASVLPVSPGTLGSPEEAVSTALETSDRGTGAPGNDWNRVPASHGRNETRVPSGGDPSAVADTNALANIVPAKPTADNTRVAFSSDTHGAAVVG